MATTGIHTNKQELADPGHCSKTETPPGVSTVNISPQPLLSPALASDLAFQVSNFPAARIPLSVAFPAAANSLSPSSFILSGGQLPSSSGLSLDVS